jgi:diguanylate cyclase (GGDEF)-like protein
MPGSDLIDPRIAADPELLRAVLAVHRELELPGQLRAMLDPASEWTGTDYGLAWGATGERRSFAPVAATLSDSDPRFKALVPVDPDRCRKWLAGNPGPFDGLGPFEALTDDWPGAPPAFTLALPVTAKLERWAGLLLLCGGSRPSSGQAARVEQLIELTRPAVGNALRVLSIRELVIKDDTASCFNRRYFEEFLPEELSRASRFRSPVSLIFLDMDNLKEVNSEHGHSMGSRTLYEVSVRVRAKIRKFDKLFRFGGDEFCIVLPETEWHGALEVAERVRDAIAGKPFLVSELSGAGVRMTASLGVASFPLHAQTQQDLIQEADRAMQRIKHGSKNAIGIAEIVGGDDGA